METMWSKHMHRKTIRKWCRHHALCWASMQDIPHSLDMHPHWNGKLSCLEKKAALFRKKILQNSFLSLIFLDENKSSCFDVAGHVHAHGCGWQVESNPNICIMSIRMHFYKPHINLRHPVTVRSRIAGWQRKTSCCSETFIPNGGLLWLLQVPISNVLDELKTHPRSQEKWMKWPSKTPAMKDALKNWIILARP